MGELSEFSNEIRQFLENYRWRKIEPIPWKTLDKPLSGSRLALVSSAGFVLKGQLPFDKTIKGGDVSFREIPSSIEVRELINTHISEAFESGGIDRDPNLAFPIDRVMEMEKSGLIGEVNHRHLSFMGSLTAPGRLIKRTAPAAADLFAQDGVDIVLLTPV
jgi:D-proline reductase (dithiol) PrdB